MTTRSRAIAVVAVAALSAVAGWYAWRQRQITLYGGVKPFMKKLGALHDATARELARGGQLTRDFVDMERLAQIAQDVFPVFKEDPRGRDPRFGPLATELMRRAQAFEYVWDTGDREKTHQAFVDLTDACNHCHQQLGNGKPPKISLQP